MKKKGKARPRKYIMYDFGTLYKCYIHCYPQQIWTYEINEEKDRVYLCNEKRAAASSLCAVASSFLLRAS